MQPFVQPFVLIIKVKKAKSPVAQIWEGWAGFVPATPFSFHLLLSTSPDGPNELITLTLFDLLDPHPHLHPHGPKGLG